MLPVRYRWEQANFARRKLPSAIELLGKKHRRVCYACHSRHILPSDQWFDCAIRRPVHLLAVAHSIQSELSLNRNQPPDYFNYKPLAQQMDGPLNGSRDLAWNVLFIKNKMAHVLSMAERPQKHQIDGRWPVEWRIQHIKDAVLFRPKIITKEHFKQIRFFFVGKKSKQKWRKDEGERIDKSSSSGRVGSGSAQIGFGWTLSSGGVADLLFKSGAFTATIKRHQPEFVAAFRRNSNVGPADDKSNLAWNFHFFKIKTKL